MNIKEVEQICKCHLRENDRVVCVDLDSESMEEVVARKKPSGGLCLEKIGKHQRKTVVILHKGGIYCIKNNKKIGE